MTQEAGYDLQAMSYIPSALFSDLGGLVEEERPRHQWRGPLWYAPIANFQICSKLLHITKVSQFTLLASTKKGSKPDFHGALGGDEAKRLYHYFLERVQQGYTADRVKDGVFQAMMEVSLVNDGPVR